MRRRKAFTLVELLVVIGIIALLIAILMPALGKARKQAQRVQCAANFRSLGQAFQIYALTNRQAMPVGTCNRDALSNYIIFGPTDFALTHSEFTMAGLLYSSKATSSPQVYYCSINFDDGTTYNAYNNPWAVQGQSTRASYGFRPMYIFGNNVNTTVGGLTNTPPNVTAKINWIIDPVTGKLAGSSDSSFQIVPYTKYNQEWPRINKYKSMAIASDLFQDLQHVLERHEKGVNVLYNDGSAKWVPIDAWKSEIVDTTKNITPPEGRNSAEANVWLYFDKY